MVRIETTFDKWQQGDLMDNEAIEALAAQYASIEDSLEPLESQKKILRDQLSMIVDRQGGSAKLPGFGTLSITAPSITTSYDAKALDALIARLVKAGQGDVAQAIADCRRETSRAGSLRITRERP